MDSRKESLVIVEDHNDACEFCPLPGRLEWFNRPVAVDENYAIAVPALGSFRPGYLLALPISHVNASCRIPASDQLRFASFVSDLALELTSMYGTQITIFEHGACPSNNKGRQSACIDHAHVHLVPGNYDLTTEAPSEISKYDSLAEFMNKEQNNSYLMLQDPGGPLLSFEDKVTSQFFRRVIASRLGISDYWDYAMFPFFENSKQTYLDFGIDTP